MLLDTGRGCPLLLLLSAVQDAGYRTYTQIKHCLDSHHVSLRNERPVLVERTQPRVNYTTANESGNPHLFNSIHPRCCLLASYLRSSGACCCCFSAPLVRLHVYTAPFLKGAVAEYSSFHHLEYQSQRTETAHWPAARGNLGLCSRLTSVSKHALLRSRPPRGTRLNWF